jgi:hypothetical protein
VLEEMKAAGVQPDVYTFNPLITVLWQCGQRRTAVDMYVEASEAGVYPPQTERTLEAIDLHEMCGGAACVATTLWLDAIAAASLEQLALPATFTVITGQGKHSRVTGESEVRDAIAAFLLEELGFPFQVPSGNPGCLKAEGTAVCEWLGALGPVAQRLKNVEV